MRVLLDECLPKKLKRYLPGHEVATVPEMGWAGIKNGALLRLAELHFDVFVTIDQSMRYQQNLPSFELAYVFLSAPDNSIDSLAPLMPSVQSAIVTLRPRTSIRIGS